MLTYNYSRIFVRGRVIIIIFKLDNKNIILSIFIFFIIIVALIILGIFQFTYSNNNLAGGKLKKVNYDYIKRIIPVINQETVLDIDERFTRPSKDIPINIKYNFSNINEIEKLRKDMNSQDIIELYFSILKEASNMLDYSGTCGSVGYGKQPYKYAYELLSNDSKNKISLQEFEKSFEGIGHINLMKILPAYIPNNTPENIKYYIIEIEVISGEENSKSNISNFKYYYGLVTTEYEDNLWKIKDIKYVAEAFLCAPYHGWVYYSNALVEIVYGEWYKLIEKIEYTEKDGNIIYVYAYANGRKYRFDFVRLTNGYDILTHENIYENNKWKEVNILKPEDQNLKFSILNPQL